MSAAPSDYLKKLDLQHIWHPFTQHLVWQESDPLVVEHADGVELIDIEGKRYLDGVSSLWCNVHGHGCPELLSALHQQVDKVCHSTLLGLSHLPIIELTKRLIRIAPENLSRVFYADSGSTAVEASLRISLEWWQKQNSEASRKKQRILSLEGAYHGDTLGAVGVGFSVSFHSALRSLIQPALRVPPPHVFRFFEDLSPELALEKSIEALKATLKQHSDSIAGMIIEPLVQGAAGIWIHPVEYLKEVARMCKEHNVLLIADEVAVGFGKTGKMFAIEHGPILPDMLVLGKGLSGGYLPISAVLASEEIFQGFLGAPEELKTFFYGQTFAGNPLAASVAVANLDLFEENKVLAEIPGKILHLRSELNKKITTLPHVDEVRSFGLMVGIELTKEPKQRVSYPTKEQIPQQIVLEARKLGAVIRPLGNVMVLMPALAMNNEQLTALVEITAQAIENVTGKPSKDF